MDKSNTNDSLEDDGSTTASESTAVTTDYEGDESEHYSRNPPLGCKPNHHWNQMYELLFSKVMNVSPTSSNLNESSTDESTDDEGVKRPRYTPRPKRRSPKKTDDEMRPVGLSMPELSDPVLVTEISEFDTEESSENRIEELEYEGGDSNSGTEKEQMD